MSSFLLFTPYPLKFSDLQKGHKDQKKQLCSAWEYLPSYIKTLTFQLIWKSLRKGDLMAET